MITVARFTPLAIDLPALTYSGVVIALIAGALVLALYPAVTHWLRMQDEWFDRDAPRPASSTNATATEAPRA